jgi:putative Holliday junction resolvase
VRILGVDPGSRRVGLALSDEDGRVALPLDTLERRGEDEAARAVAARARVEGAGAIVMGLPLDMDGSEGAAARRARRFADAVSRAGEVPVVLWDERLTTVAAERALREAGVRGKDKKRVVDQAAATVLLQGYLDAQARRGGEESDDRWGEDENDRAQAEADARRGGGRARRGR